ncbi:MAG: hypothetical protein OXU98_04180 [Gammaproteobacteria bacterium]|nr:hypothetical protein [Gammaproteobacteria bacterium]
MNQASASQIRDVYAMLADPVVRQQYRDDPKSAHQEPLSWAGESREPAGGVGIKAAFNTADTTYIALPANSPEHEIGEADLARMAAAGSAGSAACGGTAG